MLVFNTIYCYTIKKDYIQGIMFTMPGFYFNLFCFSLFNYDMDLSERVSQYTNFTSYGRYCTF